MNKNFLSYIGSMILLFAIIAFLPTELSMIIGTAFLAVAAIGMPFGRMAMVSLIGMLVFALCSGDFLLGIFTALAFIIPGWIMGTMIRMKAGMSTLIATTATVRCGLVLLCYNRISNIENIGIKDLVVGEFPAYFDEMLKAEGYAEEAEMLLSEMQTFAGDMLPAAVVISALMFVFLTYALTKFFMRRTPLVFEGMRKLSDIKLDISFVIGTFIAVIVAFFVKDTYLILIINCLYVLYVIYSIAGFAFVYRLIKMAVKNRGGSFWITVAISVMSCGMLLPAMGVAGAFVKTNYDKRDIKTEDIENSEENRKDD